MNKEEFGGNQLLRKNLQLENRLALLTNKLQRTQEQLLTVQILSNRVVQQKEDQESFLERRIQEELVQYRKKIDLLKQENQRLRCERDELAKKHSVESMERVSLAQEMERIGSQRQNLFCQNKLLREKLGGSMDQLSRDIQIAQKHLLEQQHYSHQLQKQLIRTRYEKEQLHRVCCQLQARLAEIESKANKTENLCLQYQQERARSEAEQRRDREEGQTLVERLSKELEAAKRQSQEAVCQMIQARREASRLVMQEHCLREELQLSKVKLCEFQAESRLRARQNERMTKKLNRFNNLKLL